LQAFHQARISRSAKLVEDEQWNPSETTVLLQHVVDVLVDSAVRDSPELLFKNGFLPEPSPSSPALSPPPSANKASTPPALSSPSAQQTKQNGTTVGSKHVRIEDRVYYAVSATSEVLVLLLDYLKIIMNLSTLTIDTMSRVIEFLKAFNSRTCQVVLGAGAMRSAGLKNITAKHLGTFSLIRNP
jgi:vacuolar protein sorting-associated protein 54